MKRDMPRLNILGASGHGKVVADIAKLNGYNEIYFYDENTALEECDGYKVLGTEQDFNIAPGQMFVAIGNAKIRKKIMEKLSNRNFPVLIHPQAVVAEKVRIGQGSVVVAGAVINTNAVIGDGCIINTGSSVDHDCVVEDYCHVAVGAHLCGTVRVGEGTWIGAGTAVSNDIYICGGCIIGAGSVVIKDIDKPGTYVGVPAKVIKYGRG